MQQPGDDFKLCPFRSTVTTSQVKLGRAFTGESSHECEQRRCMMWAEVDGVEGCSLQMAAVALAKRGR